MRAANPGNPPDPRGEALHPIVKATGWVSFFTDLGSEIVYPLLPEFVTGQLGASKKVLGLIEGLAEGVPALLRYFSGAMADQVKSRKGLILFGYALSSTVKPFIGLAKVVPAMAAPFLVLVLRVLDRVGKGIRTAPRDALVADVAGESRGRAFGFQRAMDHAGAMGGGLIAFFLIARLGLDLPWAIAAAAVPGILAVLTVTLFVHDRPGRAIVRAAPGAHPPGSPLGRPFQLYLVAAVLFALANSSDAFLLLRAKELGLPVSYAPMAWALLHVVKTVTSYSGGKLSDRVGRRPLLVGGWFLYAAVYAGFAGASDRWTAWGLFATYGLFFGLTEGVAKAYVADLVPAGGRGRAYGLLGMVEGLLLIPSSLLTGWLWDATGSGRLPLMLNAGFALAAALWLGLARPKPATGEPSPLFRPRPGSTDSTRGTPEGRP